MQDRLKPTTLRYSWVCCKQSLISIRGIYIYCICTFYLTLILYYTQSNIKQLVEIWCSSQNTEITTSRLSINIYWKENTCIWAVDDALLEQGMKLLRNFSENCSSLPKELSPWWFVGRFWWIPSAWPSWGRPRSSRLASRLRGCYSSVSVIFLSRIIEHMSCFTIE